MKRKTTGISYAALPGTAAMATTPSVRVPDLGIGASAPGRHSTFHLVGSPHVIGKNKSTKNAGKKLIEWAVAMPLG